MAFNKGCGGIDVDGEDDDGSEDDGIVDEVMSFDG